MRFVAVPRYYYHLTTENFGNIKLLKPRIEGYNRAEDEPKIARTCVSKTIAGCLSAIWLYRGPMYIYITQKKVNAVYTWGVTDAAITNERWLVTPTWFEKYITIHQSIMEEIISCVPKRYEISDIKHLNKQRKLKLKIQQILNKYNIGEYNES